MFSSVPFPQHGPSKPAALPPGPGLTPCLAPRSESPGPRRRSSAFQGNGSRQGSFVDRPRGQSRQWESPRGSLAGIGGTSSGYGAVASSGYGQASGYNVTSPRGSLMGASGTLPRSRSPSAPHTSFRTPTHPAPAGSRSFELGREGSKLLNGRNGPSPLLKDNTQSQSPYDTPPVGRNTLSQKVFDSLDKTYPYLQRLDKAEQDLITPFARCRRTSCCSPAEATLPAALPSSRAPS
jgi:hypothetical protein